MVRVETVVSWVDHHFPELLDSGRQVSAPEGTLVLYFTSNPEDKAEVPVRAEVHAAEGVVSIELKVRRSIPKAQALTALSLLPLDTQYLTGDVHMLVRSLFGGGDTGQGLKSLAETTNFVERLPTSDKHRRKTYTWRLAVKEVRREKA